MLSYLHRYHAGCFADVHKHLTLIALISQLQKKATPLAILDTHAGEGLYDLRMPECQKNAEHRTGILPLTTMENKPFLLEQLFAIIAKLNAPQELYTYPGSPAIIQHFLRTTDRGICIEKHPQAYAVLCQHFKRQGLQLHQRDAEEAMLALTPFKEKRGLIFIDPSFEVKKEYQAIIKAIVKTHQRFSQAVIALWYPILPEGYHIKMLTELSKLVSNNCWYCEWHPYPNKQQGMLGSGMVILNLPWQTDELLVENFAAIKESVFKEAIFKVNWL